MPASPALAASRSCRPHAGRTSGQTLATVLLPLMRRPLLTAGLLVFIDTIKELSATILLRPFNFKHARNAGLRGCLPRRVEDASVGAMIIVLAGLIPVILVSRSMEADRLIRFRHRKRKTGRHLSLRRNSAINRPYTRW